MHKDHQTIDKQRRTIQSTMSSRRSIKTRELLSKSTESGRHFVTNPLHTGSKAQATPAEAAAAVAVNNNTVVQVGPPSPAARQVFASGSGSGSSGGDGDGATTESSPRALVNAPRGTPRRCTTKRKLSQRFTNITTAIPLTPLRSSHPPFPPLAPPSDAVIAATVLVAVVAVTVAMVGGYFIGRASVDETVAAPATEAEQDSAATTQLATSLQHNVTSSGSLTIDAARLSATEQQELQQLLAEATGTGFFL